MLTITSMYHWYMARKQDERPALSTRLIYLLKRALVELEDLHTEHLAPVGISGRELGVLLLLNSFDTTSQQQVAGRLGVDRTTMVGLVDALEEKGLLARRPDADDRRRNVLELTQDGHAALTQATHASDQAEQQLLSQLNHDESAQLRTLLTRVLQERPRA